MCLHAVLILSAHSDLDSDEESSSMDEDVTDITLKGTFISLFIVHFSLQMHTFSSV